VRIREGTPADIEALRRIARTSFDRVYAFFAIRGVRDAWPFMIAESEGMPIGFLIGRWFDGTPPIGYVYFVAVGAQFRRRGVARTLVTESLDRFARRGATRVFAAVTEANEASLGLFGSLGFQKGSPSRPVAMVRLAQSFRGTADGARAPRGPPGAHFHQPLP
jgi:ribosomal protein S18 acetylase RimI-like enzyme